MVKCAHCESTYTKKLEALISQYSTDQDNNYINDSIPLKKIKANPNQPRKFFNDSKMDELISSIKEKGILQPIAVRELKNGDYEILFYLGNQYLENFLGKLFLVCFLTPNYIHQIE